MWKENVNFKFWQYEDGLFTDSAKLIIDKGSEVAWHRQNKSTPKGFFSKFIC
jgi:hypothetical protein